MNRNTFAPLLLIGMLGIAGTARADFTPPVFQLAELTQAEREQLRQNWRNLPPEAREALRQRMRDEHRRELRDEREDKDDDRYGWGYERRHKDSDNDRRGWR